MPVFLSSTISRHPQSLPYLKDHISDIIVTFANFHKALKYAALLDLEYQNQSEVKQAEFEVHASADTADI